MKPQIKLKLNGAQGNVFAVIGHVQKVLQDAGQKKQSKEFVNKAFKAGSYQNVLKLVEKYCEVKK